MKRSKDNLIDELELQLAKLANQWRRQHSDNQLDASQLTVKEYHLIFKRLWELGWDGEGLLPDSELPNDLMPKYYLERWRKSS
ncbi:MAG: hypothetical protein DPW09_26765 [Anaerolineae bacterium]|nr:hypothetical protein [Anaerolineales bacterium]MCQ3977049.1 hypothetical protein [Anaerolineae bacterium]